MNLLRGFLTFVGVCSLANAFALLQTGSAAGVILAGVSFLAFSVE